MSSNSVSVNGVVPAKKIQLKRKKWLLFSGVALIIVVLIIAALALHKNYVKPSDQKRLSLMATNLNCKPSDLQSVSSLNPTTAVPGASLELYTYRSACAINENNYEQAASVLRQAQDFAIKIHDKVNAAVFANELSNVQSTIALSKEVKANK